MRLSGWDAAQTLDTQISECGDEYEQDYEDDGGMALLRFTIPSCLRLTHLVISQTAYYEYDACVHMHADMSC